MLKQIWQWLKGVFQRLFGGSTPRGGRLSYRSGQDAYSTQEDTPAPRPLDDSDYEYLFRQLLEGVAHSWQQDRVLQWFERLKGRITYAEWVAWLRRFGERVLASPAPNNELATRLVLLGEMMLSVRAIQEIGEVAYDIGRQLLSRETGGTVWEYQGPDADATDFTLPFVSPDQAGEPTQPEETEMEAITLDELLVRMQQDPNLLQVIAQQFGLETNDPQIIIQEVINQLTAANQAATEDAETWFSQAIQEHQAGDLEQAIASYDKVIEIRPEAFQAWFNRGNVLVQLGRFEEAIASFDKSLELQPNLHEAWDHRGDALSSLGRFEEASASYAKAKEIEAS
jgi:tetratricopeptide (TPR) repeat protein